MHAIEDTLVEHSFRGANGLVVGISDEDELLGYYKHRPDGLKERCCPNSTWSMSAHTP